MATAMQAAGGYPTGHYSLQQKWWIVSVPLEVIIDSVNGLKSMQSKPILVHTDLYTGGERIEGAIIVDSSTIFPKIPSDEQGRDKTWEHWRGDAVAEPFNSASSSALGGDAVAKTPAVSKDRIQWQTWEQFTTMALVIIAERAAHEIKATDGYQIGLVGSYRAYTEPARGVFPTAKKPNNSTEQAASLVSWTLLQDAQFIFALEADQFPKSGQWIDYFRNHSRRVAPFLTITTSQSGGGATYKHAIICIPIWTEFTTQQPQSIVSMTRATGITMIAAPMRSLPAQCWMARELTFLTKMGCYSGTIPTSGRDRTAYEWFSRAIQIVLKQQHMARKGALPIWELGPTNMVEGFHQLIEISHQTLMLRDPLFGMQRQPENKPPAFLPVAGHLPHEIPWSIKIIEANDPEHTCMR